jgi:hypothetical protein
MIKRQLSGPINGSDPLIYEGNLPNMVIMDRRPLFNDIEGYELGHWWIIPTVTKTDVNSEVWILVSKAGDSALWKRLYLNGSSSNQFYIKKTFLNTPGAGTYTPTTGMKTVFIEIVGGGGAAATVNSFFNNTIICPGGGGGGYAAKLFTSEQIGSSQDYEIGAGGIGVNMDANVNGPNGGNTTFGNPVIMTGYGGEGGISVGSFVSGYEGLAEGGDINIPGSSGGYFGNTIGGGHPRTFPCNTVGGNSFYGNRPFGELFIAANGVGTNGVNGSGGAGCAISTSAGFYGVGGNGGDGLIIITEYF